MPIDRFTKELKTSFKKLLCTAMFHFQWGDIVLNRNPDAG